MLEPNGCEIRVMFTGRGNEEEEGMEGNENRYQARVMWAWVMIGRVVTWG